MQTSCRYEPTANMKRNTRMLVLLVLFVAPSFAQEPVVGVADPESLFSVHLLQPA